MPSFNRILLPIPSPLPKDLSGLISSFLTAYEVDDVTVPWQNRGLQLSLNDMG